MYIKKQGEDGSAVRKGPVGDSLGPKERGREITSRGQRLNAAVCPCMGGKTKSAWLAPRWFRGVYTRGWLAVSLAPSALWSRPGLGWLCGRGWLVGTRCVLCALVLRRARELCGWSGECCEGPPALVVVGAGRAVPAGILLGRLPAPVAHRRRPRITGRGRKKARWT